MPLLRVCLDCGRTFEGRGSRCPEHTLQRRAKQQQENLKTSPWQRFYATSAWATARRACEQRDDYACARCGTTRMVSVHHAVPLKTLYRRTKDWQTFVAAASDLSNLVTLCLLHHREAEQQQQQHSAEGGRTY